MRLWHILRSRLRSLFFRDRRESDLREELQFHLERETERLQAPAACPAERGARAGASGRSVAVEPTKEPAATRVARRSSTVWCETSVTPVARSAGRPWWP